MNAETAPETIEQLVAEVEGALGATVEALFSAGSVLGTLQTIVDLAVIAVDGCDYAGIFVVHDDQMRTAAESDPAVAGIDAIQLDTNEGPCLDAASSNTMVYVDDLTDDGRWRRFAPRAVDAGLRSALSIGLAHEPAAALNLYASLPRAFGALDRAKGLIFASLAGQALRSAEIEHVRDLEAANLRTALDTRGIVGQAQGILMEREHITADQAFTVLRRSSQHLNVKLRDIAQQLVDTGDSPVGVESPQEPRATG